MDLATHLIFGPFRVDPFNNQLWRGEEQIVLRPMSVKVLLVLAECAGEVVTKEELFKRVWAGVRVTDTVIRVCIREIRQALVDSAQTPQYIETVGRRGYRFLGIPNDGHPSDALPRKPAAAPLIVGRTHEITRLQQWFRRVGQGDRQILFITGEPGIGKTTTVDVFLARVRATGLIRIGRGHCVEHYGQGEAYMPILEALVRLTREPGGARLLAILSRHAPTWLMQMPSLLSSEEFTQLQRRTQDATPQRMLREMAEVLEVLTAERPFILVLEDLHWSDESTIALLATLTQRQERAQLMVIGTYRPSDVASTHPLRALKQELQLRDHWKELALGFLTEQEVQEYVAGQLPEHVVSDTLAHAIYRRTEGSPLFMANVVTALAEQYPQEAGAGRQHDAFHSQKLKIPENLHQAIAQRVARLDPNERAILEAASVVGMEFTAAVVAAAVGKTLIDVEEHCGELARRKHFIQAKETVEWPDGTVTACYEFIHALYQEALYERVTGGKRVELHQRVGESLAHGYRDRSHEIAAELAVHFEQGRDFHRTVQYLGHAADNANQRCAYPEALLLLRRALDTLKKLADNPERAQREITLQTALGMSLMATKGYAAPEVKSAYDRARELCLQVGETPQLVSVLRGLAMFYYVRAELQTARAIAEQLLDLVQSQQDRALLIQASYGMGGTLFNLGELPIAYHYLQRTMLFYHSYKSESPTYLSAQDTAIYCLTRMSYVLWVLGYPDQALVKSQEGISLSQELALPHNLAYTSTFAAGLRMFYREDQVAQQCAEEAKRLATEHAFPIWAAMGRILGGGALVHQGMTEQGIQQIESGIATWRAIGARISMPYFLTLLAEAYGKSGHPEKGLRLLTESLALTNSTEERWWEAELHRLKGMLTLEASGWRLEHRPSSHVSRLKPPVSSVVAHEAEQHFLKALEVARRQEAKSLELRAAMSLARLKQRQQKSSEALALLEGVYNWFTEGFETADLQDAKHLLEELRVPRSPMPVTTVPRAKTKRKSTSTRQPEAEAESRAARSERG